MSHNVKSRVPILKLARKEVDQLAEQSGEMALFTAEGHGMGVCLCVTYGDKAVQTLLYIGHWDELYHMAVGKTIMAHLPEEDAEDIIDERELPQVTENTITGREELFEKLEEIRDRGIAYNRQETIQCLVNVGAPIMN